MFTPVLQGNIVTDRLQTYFDGNELSSYPGYGTTVYDLSGNGNDGTLVGGTLFRQDTYGGVFEFDGVDDTIDYTGLFTPQFTVQIILTSTVNGDLANDWGSDSGAFPGYRPATNGFVWATQNNSTNPSALIPILWSGTSAQTIGGTRVPPPGLTDANRFFASYAFRTNGTTSHDAFFNNFKFVGTNLRNRGTSPSGTIQIARDPCCGARYEEGRMMAYLHYDKYLDDDEVWQNYNYFLNRITVKSQ